MSQRSEAANLSQIEASIQWPALLLPVRLETRRIADDICIRVFPDQPFVDVHQRELTQEEHDAGMPLRDFLLEHQDEFEGPTVEVGILEKARGEWLELARRYGATRAAWILKSLRHDPYTAVVQSAFQKTPTLFLLPDRFLFILHKDGQPPYTKAGAAIRGNLTFLPAVKAPNEDAPPEDGLFDENSKWVYDFSAAVKAGLGVVIPLSSADRATSELHFSHIVAVGLRSGDGREGLTAFNEFVESHHYTDGIEFLPYGTPTNNTAGGESAHSDSEERLLAAFDYEILTPSLRLADDRRDQCASARLVRATGIDASSGLLTHIKGADLVEHVEFPALLEALWPVTGDYLFSQMLPFSKAVDGRAQLLLHARSYLRPRGALSAIRIGNLPFGILPTSRIRPASRKDPSGWRNTTRDHPDSSTFKWDTFDDALFRALTALFPLWIDSAQNPSLVPRAGESSDPDEEIIRILGMSPHSLDYRIRPIVDRTMIRVLLLLFYARLFGMNSAFGGVADENTSITAWIGEAERITGAAEAVLRDMGAPGMSESLLLRAFYWGSGEDLYMPFVRDPSVPADNPDSYLAQLVDLGAKQPPVLPKPLLYDLLRRSIALGLKLPTLGATTLAVKRLADLPVLEFFNDWVTEAGLKTLAAREPAIELPNAELLGQLIARLNAQAFTDAMQIDVVFGSVDPAGSPSPLFAGLATRLRQGFASRLEASLTDVIDVLTYRLDAWYSALATRRLEAMRANERTWQQPAGIHWGAYGYVEDVVFPRDTATRGKPASGGGFIHAPSIGQATAAALLRSAYDSHRQEDSRKAYTTNLTSNRMRRAQILIDGIQQGQPLAALLGYQFERGLHDENLDQLIDDFRRSFPVETPPEQDTDEPQESIPARNVIDGRALSQAYGQSPSFSGFPEVASLIGRLNSNEQTRIHGLLDDLADSTDAVGDGLLFESVFQMVQGNYVRSSAAIDACSGLGRPPDLDSLATPILGTDLRHRVCLLLPCTIGEDERESGARAEVEPRFNAWVRRVFGSFADVGCRAYITQDDPPHSSTFSVTVGGLEPPLSALDFLYLCKSTPDGTQGTEIEVRLRRHVRAHAGMPTGATIRLALDEPPSDIAVPRSVSNLMELGRMLLDMMGSATVMTPSSLTHPDEVPRRRLYEDAEVDDLRTRAGDAINRLRAQETTLKESDTATLADTLHTCNGFGIDEALVESADDPSLSERRGRVLNILRKRISDAEALILSAVANDDKSVPTLLKVFKAVFGDSILVFPTFDLAPATRRATSVLDATMNATPSNDRVWLWLQQVADTHPRVRKLETLFMTAEAWGTLLNNPLLRGPKVMQVPPQPSFGWQALSDAELGTNVRAKGCQSIVSFAPENFSLASVSGLVIDEWTETIPTATVSTGVSFEYNQPGSQAPNCILLAVPGNVDPDYPYWTEEHLAEIVRDTMDLAKIRLVDLDALPAAAGIVPALFFPISQTTPTRTPLTVPSPIVPGRELDGDETGHGSDLLAGDVSLDLVKTSREFSDVISSAD